MLTRAHRAATLLAALVATTHLTPQRTAAQAAATAVRLPPATARSSERFEEITTVHELPDRRVLVHDRIGRRVALLDSMLRPVRVLFDSTRATDHGYPGPAAGLVPWLGDSALFIDPLTLSMTVITPGGAIARTRAIPRSRDAASIAGALAPTVGDADGRLVYRSAPIPAALLAQRPRDAVAELDARLARTQTDSAWLLRLDPRTRRLDTLTALRIPRLAMSVVRTRDDRFRVDMVVNPFPTVDAYAVLTTGDVAVVRGRDYRIDWFRRDGTRTRSAPIPFAWRRLSDDEKRALVDSIRALRGRAPTVVDSSRRGPLVFARSGGRWGSGDERGAGAGSVISEISPVRVVDASDLPDHLPPFAANALIADRADQLWVRLTLPTPQGTGPLYDVLDGQGRRVRTVLLPAARQVVGFGAHGRVYLVAPDSTTPDRVRLERTEGVP